MCHTPSVVQQSRMPDLGELGCRLSAALELQPERMRLEVRAVAGELKRMSGMLAHLLQVISDHERRLLAIEDRDVTSHETHETHETHGRA